MQSMMSLEDRMRIIQEIVPGKQITLAHIIANPDETVQEKVFKDTIQRVNRSAMGIVIMSPSESVIIAGDLAIKTATVEVGVLDRVNGTLIINGKLAEVEAAIKSITSYCERTLDFTICNVTKS
ncbi:MAG: BMC domain-containing protein [Cellulosilyticaceae bacterium]